MKPKQRSGIHSTKTRVFIYCVLGQLPGLLWITVLWGGILLDYEVPMSLAASVLFPLMAISIFVVFRVRGADKRFLRKNAFHVCRNCWHSLIGHMSEPTGNCPECGHAFDHAADRKAWRDDFKIPG